MQRQRSYFESHIAKIMKNHRNLINSRKELVNIKHKELDHLKEQE
jgi:hypothetical protein